MYGYSLAKFIHFEWFLKETFSWIVICLNVLKRHSFTSGDLDGRWAGNRLWRACPPHESFLPKRNTMAPLQEAQTVQPTPSLFLCLGLGCVCLYYAWIKQWTKSFESMDDQNKKHTNLRFATNMTSKGRFS